MTNPLTIRVRAKIAARYEMRNSIVPVQRRWEACRHETLRPERNRSCRAKLMTTGSVSDKRSMRPFTSRSAEKME